MLEETTEIKPKAIKKPKKPPKKRKVVNVIYMNNLPTELVVRTLKQKIQEKYNHD